MSKAIQGAAMLGGATVLGLGMMMDPGLMVTPMMDGLLKSLVVGGVSMEAGAVADALMQNRGMNITTRQPAAFRQIVYGTQRIGGVIVYRSTTGSSHDQYNFIIVLATHEIAAIEALYLDGRRVYFENTTTTGNGARQSPDGTIFGGFANSTQYTGPNGQYYNFGSLVYCEARYGDQVDGDVIGGMTANDPNWAADGKGNSPWLGGCAYVYLKVEYDANMFPSEPEIRFTVRGKNNILDPRTGTTGYTSNWALIIADVITDATWGLGDDSVNQAQLIAAANVCDEQVALAAGGTESRYACHWHYDTSTSPGNAIETMMSAAAGRLSRIGGEWYIWPAYWQGPTLSFGLADLAGDQISWTPNRPIAQLFNRVTGTYIAPNYPYNVAGNLYDSNGWYDGSIQNNFPFAFQPTNYPEYAEDQLHGYGTGVDVYLTEDGGIYLPKEIAQPCVLSVAQAQRLAKINLERNRQQGSGVLDMKLGAMQLQPIDVMQFSFAAYGWTNKQLEVTAFSWVLREGRNGGAPALTARVKVQETSQSVYEWAATEELTVYDVPAAPAGVPYVVQPPTNVTIEDDSTTVMTLSDGTTVPRLLVSWTPPADVYVNSGGKIEVQYQFTTTVDIQPLLLSPVYDATTKTYASAWIDAGSVSGDATFLFINGISPAEYQNINVQVRAVRTNGAVSAWAQVLTHPLTVQYPSWTIATSHAGYGPILLYGTGGRNVADLEPAEAGADVTGSNTAKDTGAVNGVPAATVSQGATGINTNLIADSDFKFGDTYWDIGAYFSITNDPAGQAGNGILYSGTVNTLRVLAKTAIPVSPGGIYTLSVYGGAANLSDGYIFFGLEDPSGNLVTELQFFPGFVGRKSVTFTVPAAVASITAYYGVTGRTTSGVASAGLSQPMLQLGTVATSYVSNLLDNTTGSLLHGAMSSEVRLAILPGSGNVANLGGVAASEITPISGLMPSQAGADVTAQNTAKDTSAVNGVASASISPIATLMPTEPNGDSTANHVTVVSGTFPASATAVQPNTSAVLGTINVTASGPSDIFMFFGTSPLGSTGSGLVPAPVTATVDGGSTNYAHTTYGSNVLNPAFLGTVSGLSAGAHTIELSVTNSGSSAATYTGGYMMIQQITGSSAGFNNAPSGPEGGKINPVPQIG